VSRGSWSLRRRCRVALAPDCASDSFPEQSKLGCASVPNVPRTRLGVVGILRGVMIARQHLSAYYA
jgi:hypothetical protein